MGAPIKFPGDPETIEKRRLERLQGERALELAQHAQDLALTAAHRAGFTAGRGFGQEEGDWIGHKTGLRTGLYLGAAAGMVAGLLITSRPAAALLNGVVAIATKVLTS